MDEILFRGHPVYPNGEPIEKERGGDFAYGNLMIEDGDCFIIPKGKRKYNAISLAKVHPDSIGIYINKNDKTKWEDRPKEWLHIPKEEWKGIPIFCGCNGAKYGSDIVEAVTLHQKKKINSIAVNFFDNGFHPMNFSIPFENKTYLDPFKHFEVISNQWEDHLKNEKHPN